MAKRSRKNSFSHKLLRAVAIGGAVLVSATNPYFGLRIIDDIKRDLDRKKWRQFYDSLRNLKRQNRIKVQQWPNGSYAVTITNLGKEVVQKYELDNLQIKKPDTWDGYWRFFSFDIPAEKKYARQALLQKLKELDFIMVQKSLWANPYECREELAVIARAFEVESYVHFFVVHDSTKGEWLSWKYHKQTGKFL